MRPRDFRFMRAVVVPGDAGVAVLRVTLPEEVVGTSREGMVDLRLFDARAHETPYALTVEKPSKSEEHLEARAVSVERPAATSLDVVLEIPQPGTGHNGLEVAFDDGAASCRARLEASPDSRLWEPATGGEGHLESLTSSEPLRLSYEMSQARFLRMHLTCTDREDLRRMTVHRRLALPGRQTAYNVTVQRSGRTTSTPADIMTAVVEAGQVPIHQLRIRSRTPDPYRRHGTIEVRAPDGERWIAVDRVILESRQEDTGVASCTFREVWAQEIRLSLERGDGPPLPLIAMEVLGWERTLSFLPGAEQSLSLFYGADHVRAPSYPLPLELLTPGAASRQAKLGPRRLNPDFVPEAAPAPWIKIPSWALWLILLFAFAVVAYFLRRLLAS